MGVLSSYPFVCWTALYQNILIVEHCITAGKVSSDSSLGSYFILGLECILRSCPDGFVHIFYTMQRREACVLMQPRTRDIKAQAKFGHV